MKPITGVIDNHGARYVETSVSGWQNGVEKAQYLVIPNEINDDEWVENFLKSYLLNSSEPLAKEFWKSDAVTLYSMAYEVEKNNHKALWEMFFYNGKNYNELNHSDRDYIIRKLPLYLANQPECQVRK